MCVSNSADDVQSSKSSSQGYPDESSILAAIQLALLLFPPEVRFQLQLFIERVQEITANAKRHVKPEKTLEFIRPTSVRKSLISTITTICHTSDSYVL